MNATYCLICKKLTDNNNFKTVKNNGRLMIKSNCSVCGNKKVDLFPKEMVYWIV